MSAYNKVLWSEGLFLRPQHFQQQGRYFERLVETRCYALRSHPWGCVELEFERDLLAIGKLGLRRAIGVFPDGTPFRIPEDDPVPVPLDVSTQVRDETVYLALPVRQQSGAEVDRSAGQENIVRHAIREVESRDATADAGVSTTLEVGPLRTRLMLSHETLDDYACIPIAQVIERRSDQRVLLNELFIPTVLDARAAPVLATFMTELQGLLHQRGEALAGRVAATGRGGAAEIADFLMLQAINRYEPAITHLVSGGLVHPEDLYRYCVSAAGELATFTTVSKRPTAFPGYAHDRLRESFEPVIAALRSSLSARTRAVRHCHSDRAAQVWFERRHGRRSHPVQHRGVRARGTRRYSGRRTSPGISEAAEDRARGKDSRSRESCIAGHHAAADSRCTAPDPLSRGLRLFRAQPIE